MAGKRHKVKSVCMFILGTLLIAAGLLVLDVFTAEISFWRIVLGALLIQWGGRL